MRADAAVFFSTTMCNSSRTRAHRCREMKFRLARRSSRRGNEADALHFSRFSASSRRRLPAFFNFKITATVFAAGALLVRASDFSATNSALAIYQSVDQVRAECLEGRRSICGKILRVLPDGLVVESGYTDLLRPPLTDSWLVPGTVSATRPPNLIESSEPGAACVGTIFLTDFPKARGKEPKPFDYVILVGYPAGETTYTSVGTVQKTVRRFTGTLAAAVAYQVGQKRWATVPLRMPANDRGAIPKLLSQTGAFREVATLTPQNSLVPYDLNVAFWSDHGEKKRWASVPPGELIHFTATGEWSFPPGAIFVKHF